MLATQRLSDPVLCKVLLNKLNDLLDRPLRFMEVCGTHTVSIFKSGITTLLPKGVDHLSGPGCPVCVTHDSEIELFLRFAAKPNVIIATFGDLMRVPGPNRKSLKHAQAEGARISIIYSPMDILKIAIDNPKDIVILPGIGFETTAPTIAATILMAEKEGINNIAVIPCHKLVPPALEMLLADPDCQIDGFLLPGHVSMVLGLDPYAFVVEKWGKPAIVSGFEPADILDALCRMVKQLQTGEYKVENAYPRAVYQDGDPQARNILYKVFQVGDAQWRGLGFLPMSGLTFREQYKKFDALERFCITGADVHPNTGCICGEILKGKVTPSACALFGKDCTPEEPIGPCMVSTEGSCAAYFKYNMII